jgi:hypothetical protein
LTLPADARLMSGRSGKGRELGGAHHQDGRSGQQRTR